MSRPRSRKKRRGHARQNPQGILHVSTRGYGFIHTAEGNFFIPRAHMGHAWDGDEVEIAPISFHRDNRKHQRSRGHHFVPDVSDFDGSDSMHAKRPTARVTHVLRRGHATIVGRYEIADPFGVVIPEDPHITHDIFTQRSDFPDAHDGDYVRVRITQFPTSQSAATGKVECVIGHEGDPNIDIDALIDREHLRTIFHDAVCKEADVIEQTPDPLVRRRRDITDRFVITIDPAEARDFDDAVSLEVLPARLGQPSSRIRLGVHIADVSSYVRWNSAIDREARLRGTSVYAADRVIPMLPEQISNNVCSLVPGRPRRTMTVEGVFDFEGHLLSTDIYPSLIKSHARLSYDQADAYIHASLQGRTLEQAQRDVNACRVPEGAVPLDATISEKLFTMLPRLWHLAQLLARKRHDEGALEFSSSETRVLLDDKGYAVGVDIQHQTKATSSIEQAMVFANCQVARVMDTSGLACMYRVHGAPKRSSLEKLAPIFEELGISKHVDMDELYAGSPYAIQDVLSFVHGKNDEELVSALLLRAMRRAMYADVCTGHFGLGARYYCHFTSPIRRYPDLEVHRMLTMKLFGRDETYEAQRDHMADLAQHCSDCERVADKVELDSTALKLVQYMQGYVGKVFDGLISGVSRQGVFVMLHTGAEGLIPLRALGDDHFELHDATQQICGRNSRKRYQLGQKIRVRIFAAPDHAMKLDLRLA